MRVNVIYHYESEGYWAESPDVPGFYAAASTLAGVREHVRSGLRFHIGNDVTYEEHFPEVASVVSSVVAAVPSTWFMSASLVVGEAVTSATGEAVRRMVPTPPNATMVSHAG